MPPLLAPAVPLPMVRRRSVVAPVPMYFRTPPPARIRLAAALVELPMLLATPPSSRSVTTSTPPRICVPPLKVLFVLVTVQVPRARLSRINPGLLSAVRHRPVHCRCRPLKAGRHGH